MNIKTVVFKYRHVRLNIYNHRKCLQVQLTRLDSKMLICADDTTLMMNKKVKAEDVLLETNETIGFPKLWFQVNKLKLNDAKT